MRTHNLRPYLANLAACLFALGLAAAPASAQAPPGDHEKLREEVIAQMRTMRMWKMTEELKLDEATAAKLFPLMARFDDQERQIGRERAETMAALRDLVALPNPDAKKIGELIDRVLATRGRRHALETEKMKAMRQVLSPVQQAKLVLLVPRFEEGFRQRIRETLDGAREPGGRGRGNDPEAKLGPNRGGPPRPFRGSRLPDRSPE